MKEASQHRKYPTRTLLDVEGNQRAVIDALERVVMRYDYDMLGAHLHQASMEAGERWMLNDVVGKPSVPGTAGCTLSARNTTPCAGRSVPSCKAAILMSATPEPIPARSCSSERSMATAPIPD